MGALKRRSTVGLVLATALALAMGLAPGAAMAVGAQTTATADGPVKAAGGGGQSTKSPGRTSAQIPAAVRTAVADGPTEVLVGFEDGAVVSRMTAALRPGLKRANRAAAAKIAATGYAATKRAALQTAGPGVSSVRDYNYLPVQMVKVTSLKALAALAAAPGVLSLDLPQRRQVDATPTDLSLIHQPEAAAAGYTGAGVRVAVLDTGVDYTLAGVNGAFGDCSAGPGTGSCRIDQYSDATNSGELDVDPGHHGTNVSGVIAETAPAAHLSVYNVFSIDPTTHKLSAADGDILGALNGVTRDAPAQNIRAVNMSLGSGGYNTTECTDSIYSAAFLNLRALGVVPVVAAGNDAYDSSQTFHSGVSSPACATGAVRVGAVYSASSPAVTWQAGACTNGPSQADAIACFSQTGPLLSLLAPGVDVKAAGVTESGTSQATPHVAGAVADLVSANPQATAQQIVRALTTTGRTIPDGRDGTTVHRLDIQAAAAAVGASPAEVSDPGCDTATLPANDDGSTGALSLPFVADFFGTSYPALYVNNNGNVTFQGPQGTYTPFTIGASTPPMIAPFFADVDTRGAGSGLTSYGNTTFGSRPAFCVNWNRVGYYAGHTDKSNSFQLLLVDRGEVGAGDFDIVINYNTLNWETGDASGGVNGYNGTPAGAGYSAGDGDATHFFQFPGSLSHAGLLDTNTQTGLVNGSRGTLQPGRYIFPVRNGAPPGAATLTGAVRDVNGVTQTGSPVQACPSSGGSCVVGFSGPDGHYTIVGVPAGSWNLTALPPAGSPLLPGHAGPLAVATGSTVQQDLVLGAPQAIPNGTTITDHGTTSDGIPVLYWTDPITLTSTGCTGGSASYAITQGTTTIRSGSMAESPAGSGHYTTLIDAFYPIYGDANVTIAYSCPDGTHPAIGFTIYIDPSGTVVDTTGAPIVGASVELLRADTANGPFAPVPDGSAVMSPSARSNPEITGSGGIFHWNVLAGFYQVQATKAGCHVPGGTDPAATSAVYEVPPPALGITLTLDCGETTGSSATTLTATPNPAVFGQPVVLTAQVTGSGVAPGGTVTFTAADGSVTGCANRPITAGQATCVVTFAHATTAPVTLTAVYSGDSGHPASSDHVVISVAQAAPVITWATPSPITYPAPVGLSQLNAAADIPGTFAYTADGASTAVDAVLHAGSHQLTATFTPTNAADYSTASATVTLTVLSGEQVIVADPVAPVTFGTPTTTMTARGGASDQPVTFTSATPVVCTVASTSGTNPATATVNVLAVGTCTVVASQSGTADWGAAADIRISFAVNSATQAGAVLDTSVSADQRTAAAKLTSPWFSTSQTGELLVALVAAEGPSSKTQKITSVSGGGLTWTLAARSNSAGGTAEVWQAWTNARLRRANVVAKFSVIGYRGSITVAAFTGAAHHLAATSVGGSRTGAPEVTLRPTGSNSLVWGVGHNSNVAASVSTPAGQSVSHQFARVSDTYWVQSVDSRTTARTPVRVRTLTPNTGRWQFSAVEIPAAGGDHDPAKGCQDPWWSLRWSESSSWGPRVGFAHDCEAG
jgi:Subtilase family/Bacterial Ig-like domain (group 3)/Nidogen-like